MEPTPFGTLDYSQLAAQKPPRFRCGFVSLGLSAVLFICLIVVTAMCHSKFCFSIGPMEYNEMLGGIASASILSLGLGIGGIFQSQGRMLAILGTAVSVFNVIFVPMLRVA
ncbi:MAG: hypothetical protein JWL69_1042 [Phycisphaerales bacterium]|nr:hypothetical protein [Phycisphaerales bacterium]